MNKYLLKVPGCQTLRHVLGIQRTAKYSPCWHGAPSLVEKETTRRLASIVIRLNDLGRCRRKILNSGAGKVSWIWRLSGREPRAEVRESQRRTELKAYSVQHAQRPRSQRMVLLEWGAEFKVLRGGCWVPRSGWSGIEARLGQIL